MYRSYRPYRRATGLCLQQQSQTVPRSHSSPDELIRSPEQVVIAVKEGGRRCVQDSGCPSHSDTSQCDEDKPSCGRCKRLGFDCDYSLLPPRNSHPLSKEGCLGGEVSPSSGNDAIDDPFKTSLTQLTVSNTATVVAAIQTALKLGDSRLIASVADDLCFFVNSDYTQSFGTYEEQRAYRIGAIQMAVAVRIP